MNNIQKKAKLHAVCGYIKDNKRHYPDVCCEMNCATCGWNPKEAKRRMETGEFQNASRRFNADTGAVILMSGVQRLVFRRNSSDI